MLLFVILVKVLCFLFGLFGLQFRIFVLINVKICLNIYLYRCICIVYYMQILDYCVIIDLIILCVKLFFLR